MTGLRSFYRMLLTTLFMFYIIFFSGSTQNSDSFKDDIKVHAQRKDAKLDTQPNTIPVHQPNGNGAPDPSNTINPLSENTKQKSEPQPDIESPSSIDGKNEAPHLVPTSLETEAGIVKESLPTFNEYHAMVANGGGRDKNKNGDEAQQDRSAHRQQPIDKSVDQSTVKPPQPPTLPGGGAPHANKDEHPPTSSNNPSSSGSNDHHGSSSTDKTSDSSSSSDSTTSQSPESARPNHSSTTTSNNNLDKSQQPTPSSPPPASSTDSSKPVSHPPPPSPSPAHKDAAATKQQLTVRRNVADYVCGAKLMDYPSETTNSKAILNNDNDDYMNSRCIDAKWFVIELCDSVQLRTIELANYELFSSRFKKFRVSTSDRFPVKQWSILGEFDARDVRGLQSFNVFDDKFVKYVKFELLEHYGSEHYCTLTMVRLFGQLDLDDDDEEEVYVQPVPVPQVPATDGDHIHHPVVGDVLSTTKLSEDPVPVEERQQNHSSNDSLPPSQPSSEQPSSASSTPSELPPASTSSSAETSSPDPTALPLLDDASPPSPFEPDNSTHLEGPATLQGQMSKTKTGRSKPLLLSALLSFKKSFPLAPDTCPVHEDGTKTSRFDNDHNGTISSSKQTTPSSGQQRHQRSRQSLGGEVNVSNQQQESCKSDSKPLFKRISDYILNMFASVLSSVLLQPHKLSPCRIQFNLSTAVTDGKHLQVVECMTDLGLLPDSTSNLFDHACPSIKVNLSRLQLVALGELGSCLVELYSLSDHNNTFCLSSSRHSNWSSSCLDEVSQLVVLTTSMEEVSDPPNLSLVQLLTALNVRREEARYANSKSIWKARSMLDRRVQYASDGLDKKCSFLGQFVQLSQIKEFDSKEQEASKTTPIPPRVVITSTGQGPTNQTPERSPPSTPPKETRTSAEVDVVLPAAAGNTRKDATLMRLANRIRVVERNVSVSMRYLEELSQSYRRQVESLSQSFNRTNTWLKATARGAEERDRQQQDRITRLEYHVATIIKELMVDHSVLVPPLPRHSTLPERDRVASPPSSTTTSPNQSPFDASPLLTSSWTPPSIRLGVWPIDLGGDGDDLSSSPTSIDVDGEEPEDEEFVLVGCPRGDGQSLKATEDEISKDQSFWDQWIKSGLQLIIQLASLLGDAFNTFASFIKQSSVCWFLCITLLHFLIAGIIHLLIYAFWLRPWLLNNHLTLIADKVTATSAESLFTRTPAERITNSSSTRTTQTSSSANLYPTPELLSTASAVTTTIHNCQQPSPTHQSQSVVKREPRLVDIKLLSTSSERSIDSPIPSHHHCKAVKLECQSTLPGTIAINNNGHGPPVLLRQDDNSSQSLTSTDNNRVNLFLPLPSGGDLIRENGSHNSSSPSPQSLLINSHGGLIMTTPSTAKLDRPFNSSPIQLTPTSSCREELSLLSSSPSPSSPSPSQHQRSCRGSSNNNSRSSHHHHRRSHHRTGRHKPSA